MPARRKGQHRARHHINPNKPSVFAKLPPLPAKEDALKDALKDAAAITAAPAVTAATTTAQMPVEAQIEDAATVGA